jgi:hypothetical protein
LILRDRLAFYEVRCHKAGTAAGIGLRVNEGRRYVGLWYTGHADVRRVRVHPRSVLHRQWLVSGLLKRWSHDLGHHRSLVLVPFYVCIEELALRASRHDFACESNGPHL